MERKLYFILHNIRSAYNVGSIFRTADGIGVEKIFLTGYTCTPHDGVTQWTTKSERMVGKTALGADQVVSWEKNEDVAMVIANLCKNGVKIVALEQVENSIDVMHLPVQLSDIALILGNEPRGIDPETLALTDFAIEIPMRGIKKSLNVAVATGIAGYQLYDKMK